MWYIGVIHGHRPDGVWLPQGEAERDLGLEAAPLRYPNHELLMNTPEHVAFASACACTSASPQFHPLVP